jgi:hypothetical protein
MDAGIAGCWQIRSRANGAPDTRAICEVEVDLRAGEGELERCPQSALVTDLEQVDVACSTGHRITLVAVIIHDQHDARDGCVRGVAAGQQS